jgi:hypothetical protein
LSAIPLTWDRADKAVRAYSSSKVIHRGRGETLPSLPQPPVSNFGGGSKMYCEKLSIRLNPRLSTQGPEDEFRALTQQRLPGDFRSGSLRLVVKEYSEPFACKCKRAETNLYKLFHPARTACSGKLTYRLDRKTSTATKL